MHRMIPSAPEAIDPIAISTFTEDDDNSSAPTVSLDPSAKVEHSFRQRSRGRPLRSKVNLVSLITGMMLSLVICTAYFKIQNGSVTLERPCGGTADEARRLGCRFDYMSFSWLHPRCFDEELVANFTAANEWHWYADAHGRTEILFDEVVKGDIEEAYVTWEYHRTHCIFMWQLLHRKALGPIGKMSVDSYIGNLAHTQHCGKVIAAEIAMQRVNTAIRRKFPDCGVP